MTPNHFISRSSSVFQVFLSTGLLVLAGGCGGNKVAGPASRVPVTLQAAGVRAVDGAASPSPVSLDGALYSAASQTDLIPVTFTRALLVIREVRFKPEPGGEQDTPGMDEGVGDDSESGLDELTEDVGSTGASEADDAHAGHIRFRGPFVVDLLSQSAESLDTQLVPPGVYRRVDGHLRPLRDDDWNAGDFDYLIGTTVHLEGTVDGDGGGPFTYKTPINGHFSIRGLFTVEDATPATAFITFDISRWLLGRDGKFLDPRDAENDRRIRWAIRHSVKVGMDRDHDGRMDDEMHGMEDSE